MRNSKGENLALSPASLTRLGLPLKASRKPRCEDASGLPVDYGWGCGGAGKISVPVSDILGRMGIEAASLGDEGMEEEILRAFDSILDDDLRGKLEPEKYTGGMLYLYARNSTELSEIRRFRLKGLEAKARRLGAFSKLRQIRLKLR